jgi:hypothetical protein
MIDFLRAPRFRGVSRSGREYSTASAVRLVDRPPVSPRNRGVSEDET